MKCNKIKTKVTLVIISLLVFGFASMTPGSSAHAASLEFQVYKGTKTGIAEISVLVLGRKDAVLIDGQWMLSDGKQLAEMIAKSGRRLTHILLTHGHPDHYMGLNPIVERFPDAKVLARQAVRDEIVDEFSAKWLHWQQVFGDDIPITPVEPAVFEGKSVALEGHEIRFIDMPAAETRDATAFYIPSARAIIAGDIVFSKEHCYFADLNNPKGYIEALETLKKVGPIERVYPGHGPVGGPELIDEQIEYMKTYQSIAKPGVPLPEIIKAMVEKYPDYDGELILWWTRGPGFGAFGPHAMAVPKQLLNKLPPNLVYPVTGCNPGSSALINKLFHEGFTGGHMDVLDEVFAADIQFSDPAFPPGLEGIKALVAKNNKSFEGWHFKIHDMVCDGDKTVVRWSGYGKHVGSFMGETPTQKDIELTGISIYLIQNNRIAADWVVPDNLGFLKQIGVISTAVDMTKNKGS